MNILHNSFDPPPKKLARDSVIFWIAADVVCAVVYWGIVVVGAILLGLRTLVGVILGANHVNTLCFVGGLVLILLVLAK